MMTPPGVFADGPDTVGSRTVQIETGLTVDGDPSGVSVPTLLRIGVRGDALELRIESGVSRFANGDRDWTPVGIGVKARLRNVGVAVRRGRGARPSRGGVAGDVVRRRTRGLIRRRRDQPAVLNRGLEPAIFRC